MTSVKPRTVCKNSIFDSERHNYRLIYAPTDNPSRFATDQVRLGLVRVW